MFSKWHTSHTLTAWAKVRPWIDPVYYSPVQNFQIILDEFVFPHFKNVLLQEYFLHSLVDAWFPPAIFDNTGEREYFKQRRVQISITATEITSVIYAFFVGT